jgi:hypothetical protein
MTGFIIALVAGGAIAVVYVSLAVRDIGRARSAGAAPVDERDALDGQGDGFALKAGAGALASVLLLVGISVWSGFWYVLPFLAIGSSLAVIAAFLSDDKEAA